MTLTAVGMATAPVIFAAPTAGKPTAAEIMERVKARLGGEWKPDTVDTVKAGDPSMTVTGIVTTALASLEVLRAAVKAGANMVVTSEPTFFSRADTPTPPVRRLPGGAPAPDPTPANDPVFAAKAAFLKEHNLLVWRLSEHWRMHKPDPFTTGLVADLHWTRHADPAEPARLLPPPTPLQALAVHVKTQLGNRGGLRVVGDRTLQVRSIALLPGSTPIQAALDTLPHVDAILAGEVREWETVEYVRDTVALGGKKALIYVGRIVSEEPGMRQCAEWLRTVVPEVPCGFHSAGDPYWRPTA